MTESSSDLHKDILEDYAVNITASVARGDISFIAAALDSQPRRAWAYLDMMRTLALATSAAAERVQRERVAAIRAGHITRIQSPVSNRV